MKPYNDPLDPQLSAELKALKEIPERDPQAATSGRMRFLQEAASMATAVIPARSKQEPVKKRSGFFYLFGKSPVGLAARLVLIITLAAGLLGLGGAAAVYASRDSLPGESLYPVKTWGEDVLLAFASTPQTELNLNLKYAERRMAEIDAVLDGDEELAAQAMLRLQSHMQNALQASAAINGEQSSTAMEQVRQALEQQQRLMRQLGENTDAAGESDLSQTRQMIQEQMRLMEDQLLEEEIQLQGENDREQQIQQNGEGGQGQEQDQQGQSQGDGGQQQSGQDGKMQATLLPGNPTFTPTPMPTLFPQGGAMGPGSGNQQAGGETTPMPNEPQPGTKK